MPSEAVSLIVAYVVHEDCPVDGEIYAAGAGAFARFFGGSTPGHVHQGGCRTLRAVGGLTATTRACSSVAHPFALASVTALRVPSLRSPLQRSK